MLLERGEDYDGVELTGDFTGQDASNASFLEAVVTDADLTEVSLARARLADSRFERVRGTGLDLSQTTWVDCDLVHSRLGAVHWHAAELRRVRVTGGRIDYLNLRDSTLTDVTFADCILVDPDFVGATLTRVTFEGCRLQQAEFSQVTMTDVDLSGADLVAPRGLASLRGATISALQLIDLGPALADQLGIVVAEV